MDLKSMIIQGKEARPPRVVLHGPHGIGKSTWAAGAPKPIFVQTEDGLASIGADRFPLATKYSSVLKALDMLATEEHDYQTAVIDTADWLERLVWAEVCEKNGWQSVEDPGYGKGYVVVLRQWDEFFSRCNKLIDRGMGVVILAHTEIRPYNPPDGMAYDRYQIKLHKTAAAKLEEWADAVLMAQYQVHTAKQKDGKTKAVNAEAERVVYTQERPAWRAKNRYGLPYELPMDFTALMSAIKESRNG